MSRFGSRPLMVGGAVVDALHVAAVVAVALLAATAAAALVLVPKRA